MLTIVFLFFYSLLAAQCGLENSVSILDVENNKADTTHVSIVVNGAYNNDLNDESQGVCAVKLKFKHPFMKELFIELISPSGQVVRLTGGEIVATNTQLVTWDVTFVSCLASAAPDPGIEEVWENNQLWLNLQTYVGQYYPNDGCLEDFDSGSVNGVWTFRCIDFEDGGSGTLLDASIIFCDDDGIDCDICELDPGVINNENIVVCDDSSEELNIIVDKTFYEGTFDSENYQYDNVLFSHDSIISLGEAFDLKGFPTGIYTICGLQISNSQLELWPNPGDQYNEAQLRNIFFEMAACAGLSDDCMKIRINSEPLPTDTTIFICKGEALNIDGVDYSNEGLYQILLNSGGCDSLVNLDLRVINIDPFITIENKSQDCDNLLVSLHAEVGSAVDTVLVYNWTTEDGVIIGDPSLNNLNVDVEGRYLLEIEALIGDNICRDTVSVHVDKRPKIFTFAETDSILTCQRDTIIITPILQLPIIRVEWTSQDDNPFDVDGTDIAIWLPGVYYLNVETEDGCSGIDSITVLEDKMNPAVTLNAENINCKNDEVTVMTTLDVLGRNYRFFWPDLDTGSTSLQNPKISIPGFYQLIVTDSLNGCQADFEIEIIEDKSVPNILGVLVDTLTCTNKIVIPIIQTNDEIIDYIWTGDEFSSNNKSPEISEPDIYTVQVTSATTFCETAFTFEVYENVEPPIFEVLTDSITCIKDFASLNIVSDEDLLSVTWTGPSGFTSTEESPEVSTSGTYRVTVIGNNGCSAQKELEVINAKDIPETTLTAGSFTCMLDTVKIWVDPELPEYSYLWSGPGVNDVTTPSPEVVETGTYHLTVTNIETGCTFTTSINIVDNSHFTSPIFELDILNCINDSIQVNLLNDDTKSIIYTGNEFYSDEFMPYISEAGTYYYTFTNSGDCVREGSFIVLEDFDQPELTLDTPDFLCFQESVSSSVTSNIIGTVFDWVGPNGFLYVGETVEMTEGGNYQVIGTAPNGCVSEIDFELGYDTLAPIFQILTPDTLTCALLSIDLVTDFDNNLGSIQWENGAVDILSVENPGIYTVTVTAINQCISVDSVEVFENRTFPYAQTYTDTITCLNPLASIGVLPQSAVENIRWDNLSNPTIIDNGQYITQVSEPGKYYFTLENKEGCTTLDSLNVEVDVNLPVLLSQYSEDITCHNPIITMGVEVDGDGNVFKWSGPGLGEDFLGVDSLKVGLSGEYTLKIVGKNGCETDVYFNITKDDAIPVYSFTVDTLTCDQGKINIAVVPESSIAGYQWTGPDGFSSQLINPIVFLPGVYHVIIEGTNGCIVSDSVEVFQIITFPEITFEDPIFLNCTLDSITLVVHSETPILRYNWIFPDGSLHTLASPSTNLPGTYRIQIADNYGCTTGYKTFEVIQDTTLPEFTYVTDTITCKHPNAVLEAISPDDNVFFSWNSPKGNIFEGSLLETSEDGDFLLLAINERKCKDSVLVFVPIDTLSPHITVEYQGELRCDNRSVYLEAFVQGDKDRYDLEWTTSNGIIVDNISETMIEVSFAGNYIFSATDLKNGCVGIKDVEVVENPTSLNFIEYTVYPPFCEVINNGTIVIHDIDGVPPLEINLSGRNIGDHRVINDLIAGVYHLKVTDNNGCFLEEDISIPENVGLELIIDEDQLIYFGDSILLKPQVNSGIYGNPTLRWYKGDTLICDGCTELWVRPFINTVYRVEHVLDDEICKEFVNILVRVNRDMNSAIPNIFAPGSSGFNKRFYIPQTRGIELIRKIMVFDKWAENVYSVYDVLPGIEELGWDGTFKGKDCQPGVYVVIVELELSDGRIWTYRGDVTLLR